MNRGVELKRRDKFKCVNVKKKKLRILSFV